MLSLNPFLQSLLEATEQKTKEDNKNKEDNDTKPKMSDVTKDGADDFPEPPDEPSEETNETEQEGETSDEEKGSETDDTEGAEEGSETETSEEGSQDGEESNDFSLDSDQNEGDDDDTPPDGLTDPDDDGSNDEPEEGEETNLHINILNISKIERALAKKRCLQDFIDLRSTVDSLSNVVMEHEAAIDPDIRAETIKDLNDMYAKLSDYLKYKFGYTNYEENLQNYLIFVHSVNAIVKKLQEKGISGK